MGANDLSRADLPKLDWSNPSSALPHVYDYVVSQAKNAEEWYAKKRRPKKRGGQVLRIASIVLVGVAALIPILSEVVTDQGRAVVPAAWASAALIVAATLVALDRYFGFSTGWTRFMSADLEIGRLRHRFEFRWIELEAPGQENNPVAQLQLARELIEAIDQVVALETSTWSEEFRTALDNANRDLSRHQAGT
jgi:hypothetical protein